MESDRGKLCVRRVLSQELSRRDHAGDAVGPAETTNPKSLSLERKGLTVRVLSRGA